MKIMLDPGHMAGHNPGSVSGYYEGTRMYEYAMVFRDELTKRGHTALLTRSSVTDNPSLTQRGRMAAEQGCDLFLSLHTNATGDGKDDDVSGVTVYRSVNRSGDQAVGETLGKAVAATMKTNFRACKTRPSAASTMVAPLWAITGRCSLPSGPVTFTAVSHERAVA